MVKDKRREIVILGLCLLVGIVLRVYTFDQKSLWGDEIYTFNDSRYGLKEQISFYQQNPTFLHPPLFFLLTHLFYPFPNPERDLRVIPLIFGILSIPMMYLLSRSFSRNIAPWCTLSLALMTYHISLSQDGRSYSMILFLGMAALYFLMTHLRTLRKRYLFPVAFLFATMIHTSYSSIPFVALSQLLWFYKVREDGKRPGVASFFLLNGLILLFCAPWMLFLMVNYGKQPLMDPFHRESPGSFLSIGYGLLHDWLPYAPLMMVSVILLILYPFYSRNRRNAGVLLAVLILPVAGLYLFCKLLNLTHFISSRYLVNFLPLLFITLYLSLEAINTNLAGVRKLMRLEVLFAILFIVSNLVILPFYYRAEKQDLRGLVTFLKTHLREGDRIYDAELGYGPGILHYFGTFPDAENRHYIAKFRRISDDDVLFHLSFMYHNKRFTIYNTRACCDQYTADGNRLWIMVSKSGLDKFLKMPGCVVKGYFDGSFMNFNRFPMDASIYLLLYDPRSPQEKGIDIPHD